MIEDDPVLGEMLKMFFERSGLDVTLETHGKEGIRLFDEIQPNLIMLDVVLPDMNGFDVAEEIQKQNNIVPLIFMTGTALEDEDYDRAYIHIKAKNYIKKPFKPEVALSQIKGLLFPTDSVIYQFGKNDIRIESNSVIINGQNLILWDDEFKLLSFLLKNKNDVQSRQILKEKLWGKHDISLNNKLDSCVKRLRKKMISFDFIEIMTSYGIGYKLIIV